MPSSVASYFSIVFHVDFNNVIVIVRRHFLVFLITGVNTSVAPMYLSEIAPVELRGSLGTLSQFGIVTGLLLGNILGLNEVRQLDKINNIQMFVILLLFFLLLNFLIRKFMHFLRFVKETFGFVKGTFVI